MEINKDVQTYTDKHSVRWTVQKYWYRLKNRQMIHTYHTYQQYCTKDRYTDRQTNRQDRQKRMTNRPTNRQTDSI